ncbi:MAG: M64 family metallopeptidase, partial [bacterium]
NNIDNMLEKRTGKKIRIIFANILLMSFFSIISAEKFETDTILANGDKNKQINIVFISEGYTSDEFDKYGTDANWILDNMMEQNPYNVYKKYFNAFIIKVPSGESGSDHPDINVYKDTYFSYYFNCSNIKQLICYSGSPLTVLRDNFPSYDIALMIVNDTAYGGSGGAVAATSINKKSVEIALHELGHSFANLKDEYEILYEQYIPSEGYNVTAETVRENIKWNTWIEGLTPIPTPETSSYNSVIGLFEGACYRPAGWYRPKYLCKMRALNSPFCAVCLEKHIKNIYQLTGCYKSISPDNSDTVRIYFSDSITFNVSPFRPETYSLSIKWYMDTTEVGASRNLAYFSIGKGQAIPGTHKIKVFLEDTTSLVRNDQYGILKDTIIWNLQIGDDQPTLVREDKLSHKAHIAVIPSPFNRSCIIRYSIEYKGTASIQVFDIRGNRQKEILDKRHDRGEYSLFWEPAEMNSGSYVIRLINGNQVSLTKVFFLK